ncbi:hypothetical protein BAUCODRAFT_67574 [Baudoinia panamericana UAMH 10762]|uniref:Metallo-beta-lactamase domain-containing protein n=1 Tax=Baudoinia panamericana (strain UAMH 10762) TaxID=717646 RepID=M2MP08_BAUPA|nr:uncharacterized protein BAUCODRAFT_67574 [Baudoinia panamericana UAMH 10762]EMC98436.1 hypothetical protein BAUCODRAFT_67574 [Baudoinia panamericana UAMH 10762]
MPPLEIQVVRHHYSERPEHHILADTKPGTAWTSYLPWKTSASGESRTRKDGRRPFAGRITSSSTISEGGKSVNHDEPLTSRSTAENITGFRNPWQSWHQPTHGEVWRSLQWGLDKDPCIDLGAKRALDAPSNDIENILNSREKQAAALLRIVKPDFTFDSQKHRARVTWLGHAGVLIQLPPLKQGAKPVRLLFDPIFSMRCSPSQLAGPLRSYPPPCAVEDLPEIDVFVISHNHYDHLDYDTVLKVWERNKQHLRFVVPLANRQWIINCGISEDRVTELDWWDAASLTSSSHDRGEVYESAIRLTCTPAQHNSGRGFDSNETLWSSWYLEHPGTKAASQPYRIFFAGDTGYQFHDSPGWPPPPPSAAENLQSYDYPACPGFEEIADRLGSPHLLLMPVSVGATHDFVRSLTFMPDATNPVPRHTPGVTAHNHMPPWDAVRVLRLMTKKQSAAEASPVAIAMHWGTWAEPEEVLKTLGQLEWACVAHKVQFARELGASRSAGKTACFLAINHGQSVDV